MSIYEVCGILTVKLNQDITRNLPIELIHEIVSYTYKFKDQLKFQKVLANIEDGTLCVLQTLTVFDIQCGMNPMDDNYQRLDQWLDWMYPYNDHDQYEGASRYVTQFDVIHSSKQMQKQLKRCKYQTREEIAALIKRKYNGLGPEYDDILEDDDIFDQAQCFDYYFH